MGKPARTTALLAFALYVSLGCAASPAGRLAITPGMEDIPATKCLGTKNKGKPLVVDWHASERGDLETAARNNLVVVKYDGCQMQVMSHCEANGNYDYAAFQPKQDRVRITDANQLYSSVPMGAAKLEAKLASSGELGVDTTLVGKYRSDRSRVELSELNGDCEGATHLVTGMTIGAFEFFARAKAEIGAGVKVANSGASGDSRANREVISRDGDRKRCEEANSEDAAPPEGCSSLVRLEVSPIGGVDPRTAAIQSRGFRGGAGAQRSATPWPLWIGAGVSLATAATGGVLIGIAQPKYSEADGHATEAAANTGQSPSRKKARQRPLEKRATLC